MPCYRASELMIVPTSAFTDGVELRVKLMQRNSAAVKLVANDLDFDPGDRMRRPENHLARFTLVSPRVKHVGHFESDLQRRQIPFVDPGAVKVGMKKLRIGGDVQNFHFKSRRD